MDRLHTVKQSHAKPVCSGCLQHGADHSWGRVRKQHPHPVVRSGGVGAPGSVTDLPHDIPGSLIETHRLCFYFFSLQKIRVGFEDF